MNNFTLWLEFEVMNPHNWQIENEFCTIQVNLPDGRYYSLTVGTYTYLKNAEQSSKIHPRLPDLIVDMLNKVNIENAIRDLLQLGNLQDLLNPSVYDAMC